MSSDRTIVIAAFREDDLRRLLILLACYESPYSRPSEAALRDQDEQAHRELRRQIERLLSSEIPALGADGGKL
jgi:hypothetical protein